MNTINHQTGRLAIFETIQSGGDVSAHLTQLFEHRHGASGEILGGALSGLVEVHAIIKDVGGVPQFDDPDLNGFLHAGAHTICAAITQKTSQWDTAWLASRVSALVWTVSANRHRVQFNQVSKNAQAATPSPIEVRVVGMPERVTESSVSYDTNGNIQSTRQTEKDA
jgi:hypothetical protein